MKESGIVYIFFGRFEEEKGIKTVIEAIKILYKAWKAPMFIFCWQWTYEKELYELMRENKNIEIYPRLSKDDLFKEMKHCQFCLMPSLFLETFGLSAVEALSQWLGVIWYKKWWLRPFIMPWLEIPAGDPADQAQLLADVIQYSHDNYKKYEEQAKAIAGHYSKEVRQEKFFAKYGQYQNILLVSDYLISLWGIEMYVKAVWNLLQSNNKKVHYFWFSNKSGLLSKIQRLFLMLLAYINIYSFFKINNIARKEKIDMVFFNSVIRFIWIFGLFAARWKRKVIILHDFGYLHPYPSKVYQEEQLINSFSFKSFISIWRQRGVFSMIAAWAKFLYLKLFWYAVNTQIDEVLIPSDFYKEVLLQNKIVNKDKIVLLEHFY